METELFHADRKGIGRTERGKDITKLIVTFRSFVHAPTKCKVLSVEFGGVHVNN